MVASRRPAVPSAQHPRALPADGKTWLLHRPVLTRRPQPGVCLSGNRWIPHPDIRGGVTDVILLLFVVLYIFNSFYWVGGGLCLCIHHFEWGQMNWSLSWCRYPNVCVVHNSKCLSVRAISIDHVNLLAWVLWNQKNQGQCHTWGPFVYSVYSINLLGHLSPIDTFAVVIIL